jgi:hypothetical protein
MPCNSEYMDATDYEREISQVACLLDELADKKWSHSHWNGYHPRIYCKLSRVLGDKLTQELCTALQKVNVTQYSLEMQIWWRDHQAADKARCNLELEKAQTDAERKAALEKLTPYERDLLGL